LAALERPEPVTDLTGARHRPLVLTEPQRRAMATRVMVQGPTTSIPELARSRRRIEGLPVDVLFALEALALLAEQGNDIAKKILADERVKLGIDRRSFFGG
jgi:hypothetical protein